MKRKAMIFKDRLMALSAFYKFRTDNPQYKHYSAEMRSVTPKSVIRFIHSDNLDKLRGYSFDEIAVVDSERMTEEEIDQIQLAVIVSGSSVKCLGMK